MNVVPCLFKRLEVLFSRKTGVPNKIIKKCTQSMSAQNNNNKKIVNASPIIFVTVFVSIKLFRKFL